MELKIILYSTNCPRCKVIEKRLKDSGYEFETVTDMQEMVKLGLTYSPSVNIDGRFYNFNEMIVWFGEQRRSKENCDSCKID